jgi:hypothetical protein
VGLPHFRNAETGELLPSGPAAPEGRLILPGPSASRFSIQMDPVADLPKEFALMQNYPNPFNPSTVIEFALPVPSRVTLRLYNLLGQEVAQVAESRQYPAGTHSLRVDAGNLGSGMYMYRITAQGANQHTYSETRKMLLLK